MPRHPLIRPHRRVLLGGEQIKRGDLLKDTTIRDFSGGWNVIDNDLNLSSKFAKLLQNFQRNPDGSLSVRPGTRLFAETAPIIDEILNIWYFSNHLIIVGRNGKMVAVDGQSNVKLIWDDEAASKLPGSPLGWSTGLTISTAAPFSGEFIIVNGVDKPLTIDGGLSVTFLNDLATGSNANTPIGRYVKAHGRYIVIAGILGNADRIAISDQDTSGVFVGDPAPNVAVNIDLGSRVPEGSDQVRGLGRFRDKLIVAFDEILLPGTLDGFNDAGDHVPVFDDAIEAHGSIGHRVIQTLGEEMLFVDVVGVPSLRRALFTGNVTPERVSRLIDPEVQKSLSKLSTVDALELRTWAALDKLDSNFMLFVPNNDDRALQTETRCFVWKRIEQLKVDAWSEWLGWNFIASARSSLDRMFHAKGTQIFIQGNESDQIFADFVGDQETFSDDTVFTDGTGWTPVGDDSGIPIEFAWELPWFDNESRFSTKEMRAINFDTKGKAEFIVKFFVDNIYDDRSFKGEEFTDDTLFSDDTGFDVPRLDPTLTLKFAAGDEEGLGGKPFGTGGMGGGRPTQDERLYAFTAKYKIGKLRIEGSTREELKIISLTMAYLDGGSPRR